MKDSKLAKKIRIFMLLITVSVCAAIFLVAYHDIDILKNDSIKMNKELSKNSSEVITDGIVAQTNSTIMQVTAAKAESNNKTFANIQTQIEQLCEIVGFSYKYGDLDDVEECPHPFDTPDKVLMGRCAVTKGHEITEEIVKEEKVLSFFERYGSLIYEKNADMMNNVMIGTTSGIFYRYSDYNSYDENYDLTTRRWFTEALENPGTIIWSDAYADVYGVNVVTVSCAYKNEKGEYAGVVASDIKIQTLINNILLRDKINGGYAFLLDGSGKILAHPYIKTSDEAENLIKNNSELETIIKYMVKGGTGKATFEKDSEQMLIFYAPIEVTGWSYGMVIPYSTITEPARKSAEIIEKGSDGTQEEMTDVIRNMMATIILIFILVVILLSLAAYQMAEYISNPIKTMVSEMEEIGKGNFDSNLKIRGNDELTVLGDSINQMAGELKKYVTEITEVTAEKQRIGAELDLATKIQASSLPNIFPPFPERKEFDLYATMHPAKEVGGDFYDFFLIDDDHLALVIADVSGKGVGAALFMMISKVLVNNQSMYSESPAEVLESVNERLCKGNEAEMFVTVWLGILEISTGVMRAANAGHEYPAIKRANGEYELFKDKHGFVLGGMEGISFKEYEIKFEKGDSLFVYTDGVAEATNADNELFGIDRMLEALNKDENVSTKQLLQNVTDDINDFVKDAPQFDDITMLTMTYYGV